MAIKTVSQSKAVDQAVRKFWLLVSATIGVAIVLFVLYALYDIILNNRSLRISLGLPKSAVDAKNLILGALILIVCIYLIIISIWKGIIGVVQKKYFIQVKTASYWVEGRSAFILGIISIALGIILAFAVFFGFSHF